MPTLLEVNREIKYRLDENNAELARRTLLGFTTYTFDGKYEVNWHHELVSDEIDMWLEADDPYNLALFMPPRHGKSELSSRMLPGYVLGKNPDRQIILASYNAAWASDLSRDAQKIMLSENYARVFPGTQLVTKGNKRDMTAIRQANEFSVVGHRGKYRASGILGGITGRGADIGIIDDPFKNREEAESETIREKVIAEYKASFRTRLEKGGRILMLLTRWHLYDLAGWCINMMENEPDSDQWRIISLPAFYEKSKYSHPKDMRKEGEALWPGKYPVKALKKTKAVLGSYDWGALYQQQPVPPGGAVIKRDWLQVIDHAPQYLKWVRYWDLAVTKKTTADHTASGQMAIDRDGNLYVKNFVQEQQEWPTVKRMIIIISVQEKCPVGIEDVATQKGFVQALLTEKALMNIDLRGYSVDSDKKTRALPWVARAEAGKFYIVRGKGLDSYINELVNFTGIDDKEDDQVDWTSGAYKMLADYCEPELFEIGDYDY